MENQTYRAVAEIEKERDLNLQRVEELAELRRTKPDEFKEEHETEIETCLDTADKLVVESKAARQAERLAVQRAVDNQPAAPIIRTLPKSIGATVKTEEPFNADAVKAWSLLRAGNSKDQTPENIRRCRAGGLSEYSDSFTINVDYSELNNSYRRKRERIKRTVLSTGGTASGAEWGFQTYSSLLTNYMLYQSPFLGECAFDTSTDLAPKTFFIQDDTAMKSSQIGGSETSPSISDTNMVSSKLVLQYLVPGISSGYQKASYEELKSVTFDLQDKIAEAAANSDARYLEDAVLNGTASLTSNTVTGFRGVIASAANALGGSNTIAAGAINDNTFEDILATVPVIYRKRINWVTSRTGMSLLRKSLKDDVQRPLYKSLLEYSEENDPTILRLKGQPIYESEWMPDATSGHKFLVGFVPDMYQVRAFGEKRFDFLREKFHPLLAWTSIGYWAGGYRGPTGTAFYLQLT